MSRKLKNPKAGSAGDGESFLPSYESSPRKTPELGTTGPFGDHSTAKTTSTVFMYKVDNSDSSTDSDQESYDLKMEYLQRLKQIREKLASIDIANKGYYSNRLEYSPVPLNRCTITEITDDEFKNDLAIINESISEICVGETSCNFKNTTKEENKINNSEESTCNQQNSNQNCQFKSTTSINLAKAREDTPPKNSINNDELLLEQHTDKKCNLELKTIYKYGSWYNTDSSSIELLDLNYNPPKKKPCIRVTTPKIVLPEKGIPLISTNKNLNPTLEKSQENIKTASRFCSDILIEKDNHIFPEVQVECAGNIKETENNNVSYKDLKLEDDKDSLRKSNETTDLYVLFLDPVEQSRSETPESNRTVITETTATTESPTHKPKKRRLFLRSARNQVKPTDKISLWEEIRTMEAINRRKREESSSSQESFFQKIMVSCEKPHEPEINLVSIGGLDVPHKTSSQARFPSITKITKFCSSVFNKKPQTCVTEKSDTEQKDEHVTCQQTRQHIPKVANTLLNLKKEQDFNLDRDPFSPSDDDYSDYSYSEDSDPYYEPFCFFCPCF